MSVTDDQRMVHLASANHKRMTGAAFKRHLSSMNDKDALVLAAQALSEGREEIAHLRIHKFLEFLPRFGDTKVERVLKPRRIWPLRKIGQLTERQRNELAGVLVVMAASGRGPDAMKGTEVFVPEPRRVAMVQVGPFRDWLLERLERAGSRQQLAWDLGVTEDLLYRWLHRVDRVRVDLVDRALVRLGLRVEDLYPGVGW